MPEPIERSDYDEWFLDEVEKGLAQIERGQTLSHEEVGTRIEALLDRRAPGRSPAAGRKA